MNLTQLSLTLFSIACISISVQSAELQPLPTHTSGRVLVTTDGSGNKVYEYSWPAIYFETAFNGDSLTIKFDLAFALGEFGWFIVAVEAEEATS